jgi:hypothetical protein
MHGIGWRVLVAAPLAAVLLAAGASAAAKKLDFEKAKKGLMPAGFSAALTGKGGPVAWMIAEDPTAPSPPRILAQSSTEETENRFPLCIYDRVSAKDVAVSVRFKVVAGKVARAAGLAVRVRGANDYYAAVTSALGGDVQLDKVVGGTRTHLAATKAAVPAEEWHALKLEAHGKHLVVSLDGRHVIEADDASLAGPGRVALVTQADSVTFFDDLEIDARGRPAR